MLQPLSYEVQGETDKVYKLKKKIYGLNQSPRAWFDRFSIVVAHYELRRSSFDHYIFVKYFSTITIILIDYVGDIFINGDDHQSIIQLKTYLSSHFHINDLDFLGSRLLSLQKVFVYLKENILLICWKN